MAQSVMDGAFHVNGRLTAASLTLPSGTVTNASIPAAAGIEATKVVHRHIVPLSQAPGSAIVAETREIHICRASGTLQAIEAAITGTIATGADRTVTVDLHKSTGAAAFATVLSATCGFTNLSTLRAVVSGTLSSTALVDGDLLRIVVTVAGAAGNQALGLNVAVTFDENPQ